MNKLDRSLERAAEFIWRNARLLERAMFAREFLDGSSGAVVNALVAYRNPDGGFGNALEPDVRAPGSMPLHCEQALRVLQEADIRNLQLASGAAEYLSSVAEPSARVEIVSAEFDHYPRASHSSSSFGTDSPNPTAGLEGLLRFQTVEHPWLTRATWWCERRLKRPLADGTNCCAQSGSSNRRATERAHRKRR